MLYRLEEEKQKVDEVSRLEQRAVKQYSKESAVTSTANIEALLKRANFLLEDGDFSTAIRNKLQWNGDAYGRTNLCIKR